MIEPVNFFGSTFVIFNHFQHGPDAIPLKKVKKSNQQIYAIGSISTAIHILAWVILKFAKKS